MLHEQYFHPEDLLTPSINDDGVHKIDSSLTSLDFYLLDDIDLYLTSAPSTKEMNNDLINDSQYDNSQHIEEFFCDIDLGNLNDIHETSDLFVESITTDEIDIEQWISQASFPSPPTDTNSSSPSTIEDASSNLPWTSNECNADMIVPPSPSLSSSIDSPSMSSTKRQKLSTLERKLRKKGQNKTAAEKYRIKKKSERHQLLDRHSKLQGINHELKLELENLTYRVEQFKKLFADLVPMNQPISS